MTRDEESGDAEAMKPMTPDELEAALVRLTETLRRTYRRNRVLTRFLIIALAVNVASAILNVLSLRP